MRGWRYFATRLNGNGTETLLDPDLPLEGVNIDDVLSGHASITGTISPRYARLVGPDGYPLLDEWSTAIYAENDGDIRAGCILTNSGFNGPEWELESTGFTGYALDMPYTGGGYKGVKIDAIDAVREIWRHIQAQPGGNIGLEVASTKSGVIIGTELKQAEFDTQSGPIIWQSGPYRLNWYENHNLAGDIDDLAAEIGFDYHERHYWDGDVIRHRLDIGYPKIGRKRNDLRFVFGVNVFDPVTVTRDGETYASGTMVLGAGEGSAMVKSIREPGRRPGGRLRRIAVVSDDTIKTQARADKRADAENQWRSKIDELDSIIVRDHPNARLGAAQVGDEIVIEGQGDWFEVSTTVRILSISYSPNDGSVAEYSIARTDRLTS